MSAWDRVERLIGAENLKRLGEAHVAVIGVGSGGGFVALSLAMSGVGHFTLVDMEPLEPPNLVRHVADARYLGVNKAEAVADLIRQRNPGATIRVIADDVILHPEALDGVDLIIAGVDGEPFEHVVDDLAMQSY